MKRRLLLIALWQPTMVYAAESAAQIKPMTETEATQIVDAATAGAKYSLAVVRRNVVCQTGTSNQCADFEAKVYEAKQHQPSPVSDTWKVAERSACHATLLLLAEMWMIDYGIALDLRDMARKQLGRERLVMMKDRDKLWESHGVNHEVVKECMNSSPVFAAELERLSKKWKVPEEGK